MKAKWDEKELRKLLKRKTPFFDESGEQILEGDIIEEKINGKNRIGIVEHHIDGKWVINNGNSNKEIQGNKLRVIANIYGKGNAFCCLPSFAPKLEDLSENLKKEIKEITG